VRLSAWLKGLCFAPGVFHALHRPRHGPRHLARRRWPRHLQCALLWCSQSALRDNPDDKPDISCRGGTTVMQERPQAKCKSLQKGSYPKRLVFVCLGGSAKGHQQQVAATRHGQMAPQSLMCLIWPCTACPAGQHVSCDGQRRIRSLQGRLW
jgi:hypothetical protein